MNDLTPVITLSIDIGSTRTHVAAVDIDKPRCVDRIDSDNNDFDAEFAANIKRIINTYPQIRRVNISSCVRSLAAKAKEICVNLCINYGGKQFDAVELIRPHDGLPVVFKYENPNTLGADRVCDALACAALFKGESCVIIDAGTAITVDYLRDGKVFEGGAILPGCSTQFAALHTRTDALPLIDIDGLNGINGINNRINNIDTINVINVINNTNSINSEKFRKKDDNAAISLPSTSTVNCIKAGVLYGTAGAVDRCINECLRVNGNNNVSIVATGGGWELVRPLVNREAITVPDLTLIGAGVYRFSSSTPF